MAGTVGAYQASTFTDPQNGQTPIDADQVTDNDNALGEVHNDHDADATIHVQSSVVASRPVAGTAQRVWLTTDHPRRIYLDSGSAWQELHYRPRVFKELTGMADATGVQAFTIAVPNAADSIYIMFETMGRLGAGGDIGAHEGAGIISHRLVITRTPGVNAVATLTTTHTGSLATVAGGDTGTPALTVGSVGGAVDEVNTFAVNLTVTRGGGASANHVAICMAEILMSETGAITIAPT